MRSSINKAARQELEDIRIASGGFIKPEDVLKAAKKKTSSLHKYFEWSDNKAAEMYRLKQARELIQVSVVYNEEIGENVRAFVSLSHDRAKQRGYRSAVVVMDDKRLFQMLLDDAKAELANFSKKYERLRKIAELSGLFSAIEEVLDKPKRGRSRKEERASA